MQSKDKTYALCRVIRYRRLCIMRKWVRPKYMAIEPLEEYQLVITRLKLNRSLLGASLYPSEI